MPIDVDRKGHDSRIRWIPPQSDTDARLPTAEEMDASYALTLDHIVRSRSERPDGLVDRPIFTATTGSKGVVIPALRFWSQKHPELGVSAAATVQLPALNDTVLSVSRFDRLYLLCFHAEVDELLDPDLTISFTWRNQAGVIQSETKENTRRIRGFYLFVWAPAQITENDIWTALPESKEIVVSKAVAGAELGAHRIYSLDANLNSGSTYRLVEGSLTLIDTQTD